ncbi:hypothetical protein P872_15275 [Rhodonellum psychrophilum GCM71 = DSM 17998]|uniref:Uncharacterized protein n=1 Tax=Rhodonellum psychrophilum GCM71 = DSM 17998 TaxID=1123057 RepID=U5C241_9BACT|nr:hypothetical protein P872_15275 [Rhodonellum psychrophilum GCM71 = DSM 17998]
MQFFSFQRVSSIPTKESQQYLLIHCKRAKQSKTQFNGLNDSSSGKGQNPEGFAPSTDEIITPKMTLFKNNHK